MGYAPTKQRRHRLTNEDIGQGARFDELDMYGLYASPHHESSFLVNRIDNAGQVMLAARREPEYDEYGFEIEGTGQTELDAYWVGASLRTTQARDIDPIDLTDDDLDHLPLEAVERVKGLQSERKRHREKALAADLLGIDRATRCRVGLEDEYRERRRTYQKTWAADDERGRQHIDPFEDLSARDSEQVREAAVHLADALITGPTSEALEHRLALKVRRGQDIISATSNLQDQLYQEAGVIQPIATVPAVPSKYNVEADIQGEVITLWQPKASNQQQVGIIADETGRLKFTVWIRSNQGVILHEGDVARIVGGKVGAYNEQATLAADSETRISVLERGDGPAPRGDIPNVDWSKYDGRFKGVQRHRACTIPSLSDPRVSQVSLPTHRPRDRLDADDGRYAATHWLKAIEIYDADGDIPLPEWWKDQANVLRVDVPEDADSESRGKLVAEQCRAAREAGEGVDASDASVADELETDPRPRSQSIATDARTSDEEVVLETDGGNTRTLWVRLPEDNLDTSESMDDSSDEFFIGSPSTSERCPECDHDRAYYDLKQLRAADEAPTRLFTCSECGHRWREDD